MFKAHIDDSLNEVFDFTRDACKCILRFLVEMVYEKWDEFSESGDGAWEAAQAYFKSIADESDNLPGYMQRAFVEEAVGYRMGEDELVDLPDYLKHYDKEIPVACRLQNGELSLRLYEFKWKWFSIRLAEDERQELAKAWDSFAEHQTHAGGDVLQGYLYLPTNELSFYTEEDIAGSQNGTVK